MTGRHKSLTIALQKKAKNSRVMQSQSSRFTQLGVNMFSLDIVLDRSFSLMSLIQENLSRLSKTIIKDQQSQTLPSVNGKSHRKATKKKLRRRMLRRRRELNQEQIQLLMFPIHTDIKLTQSKHRNSKGTRLTSRNGCLSQLIQMAKFWSIPFKRLCFCSKPTSQYLRRIREASLNFTQWPPGSALTYILNQKSMILLLWLL